MNVEIVMPKIGEDVQESTVTRWIVRAGERVSRDDALLEVLIDKVDSELLSPATGTLNSIRVQAGETVRVGEILGHILVDAEAVGDTRPNVSVRLQTEATRRRSRIYDLVFGFVLLFLGLAGTFFDFVPGATWNHLALILTGAVMLVITALRNPEKNP